MFKPLEALLVGIPIKQIEGPTNCSIQAVCFDSRKAVVDSCFIAVNGSQVNGYNYIENAIALGSKVIVCERFPDRILEKVTYVVVESTIRVLGIIVANFYDQPSKKLKIIVVTGTNGKTTVVHLLYNIFMHMGYKVGMLSTIHNKVLEQTYTASHTTPDPVELQSLLHLMVETGCNYCFMEASSHAIVQERLAGIDFTGAIFTNITHDHLDYHINFINYIQAKKKLFDDLPDRSFALVNQEDKKSFILLQNCKAKKFTFSLRAFADFRAKIVRDTLDGLELAIGNQLIWFKLLGSFNASNLLAAYGAAQLLGLNSQESLIALSAVPPILGRMNKVCYGQPQHIIIDYAHTPDAIRKVISTLRKMIITNNRLITIMGCGGNRDQQKRVIIGKILSEKSDIAIFTSDNPRDEAPQDIIDAMQKGVSQKSLAKVIHILDRAMAIKTACLLAGSKDIILIAGKGHQYYEEIKGTKHFFCEKEIVRENI